MTLAYVGNKGEKLDKKLKQDLKSKLPVIVKTQRIQPRNLDLHFKLKIKLNTITDTLLTSDHVLNKNIATWDIQRADVKNGKLKNKRR